MRVAIALCLSLLGAGALAAQPPASASPALAFEVATVKLNPEARSFRFSILPGGQLVTGTEPGTAQVLSMLRALLTERFGLHTRDVQREMPSYHLVVDRPDGGLGQRLLPATEDSTFTFLGRSMAKLAADLQIFVGRPVIDRTGLKGRFDVERPTPD